VVISFVGNVWLTGTPCRINVDATDNGNYVSAYGAGLVQGSSGQKLQFCVTRGLLQPLIELFSKAVFDVREVSVGADSRQSLRLNINVNIHGGP